MTNLPETIAFKAQGESFTIETATMHPDAIAAIFTYGARRWFQDHVNAKAKDARDNKEPFDVKACVKARAEAARSGDITSRGAGAESFDDMETELYKVAVSVKSHAGWEPINTAFVAAKGLPTAERMRAVLSAIETLSPERQDVLTKAAETNLATLAALSALDVA